MSIMDIFKFKKERKIIRNLEKFNEFDYELSAHYETCISEYINAQVDTYINLIKCNLIEVEECGLELIKMGVSPNDIGNQLSEKIELLELDKELKCLVRDISYYSIFIYEKQLSELDEVEIYKKTKIKEKLEKKIKEELLDLLAEMVSDSSGEQDKYEKNIEKIMGINKKFMYEINNVKFRHSNLRYIEFGKDSPIVVKGKMIYNPDNNVKISVSTNKDQISSSPLLKVTNTILVDRANIIDIQTLAKCLVTDNKTGSYLEEGEIFLIVDDKLEYEII